MLLVAIDTSDKQGSIALARGDADGSCEILELVPLTGGLFSAQLIPQIADVLLRHRLNKADLAAFAVTSGPGSFTGLRIGLSAVKGLAEALQKPIAAVSRLQAIAVASGLSGKVLAALDAGRGEVYAGEYEVSHGQARMLSERMMTLAALLESPQSADSSMLATPDKLVADAAHAKSLPIALIERPQSDLIARLGWKKILAGDTVSADALEANYVRSTAAELYPRSNP